MRRGSAGKPDPAKALAHGERNARVMDEVDAYQARGNMLLQMGCILTKEEQDKIREEVLDYDFS